MRIILYIVGLLVIIFGLSFSMLNAGQVTVHYYIGTAHISLALLLAIALGIGLFFGVLFMSFSWLRLKKNNMLLKQQLKMNKQV